MRRDLPLFFSSNRLATHSGMDSAGGSEAQDPQKVEKRVIQRRRLFRCKYLRWRGEGYRSDLMYIHKEISLYFFLSLPALLKDETLGCYRQLVLQISIPWYPSHPLISDGSDSLCFAFPLCLFLLGFADSEGAPSSIFFFF